MCDQTLTEKSWGTYPGGVVSSSGVGDGSYQLYVAKDNGKVVGFFVDFGIARGKFVDPNFYMKKTRKKS